MNQAEECKAEYVKCVKEIMPYVNLHWFRYRPIYAKNSR